MIVPMKKVTLLTSLKHRDATLMQLRKLGVLHIQDFKPPISEDIQSLEMKLDSVDRALQIIPQLDLNPIEARAEQEQSFVEQALSLNHQKEGFQRELAECQEIHHWFKKWGAISFNSIQQLKEKGVFIRLYVTDRNFLKRLPSDKIVHIEKEEGGAVYLALFGQAPDDKLDLKEEQIPQIEHAQVKTKIFQLENEIDQVDQKLSDLAGARQSLITYKNDLTKRLTLNRVKYGMGEEAGLSYLQGFCPEETVSEITRTADQEGWGYIIADPDDPSEVPTVIQNPKPIRIIEPLFKFMGTLPGYDEMDVSTVFLGFFTIFYAMIVGDAAYGIIFLLLTYLMDRKTKNAPREFFRLMYLLSFATIIWGMITGTWFGSEKLGQLPFLKIFVIDKLDSFSDGSQQLIMQLTFIIGAVHLTIAHLMSGLRKIRTLNALADLGWIGVVWAMLFVANYLVLGKPLQKITLPLIIAGIVLILVFSNFQKNIFKGMAGIIFNLPFSVIGSFSDIVSYIRLFAVGFATVIVATNFNNIIIGSGVDSIARGIFVAIILFLAHALNLILCAMSVLVHGIRLNMLEFSGHIGIQWTGKAYEPFKE